MRKRLRIIRPMRRRLRMAGEGYMRRRERALRLNVRIARAVWGNLPKFAVDGLRELTSQHSLSVALGDIQYIDGHWYVTYAGLLRVASRNCCAGINVRQVRFSSDPVARRWVFKATVYKRPGSEGFVGYGDADP